MATVRSDRVVAPGLLALTPVVSVLVVAASHCSPFGPVEAAGTDASGH